MSANSTKAIALCPVVTEYMLYKMPYEAAAASPPGEWQYIIKNLYLPVLKWKTDPTATSRARSTSKFNHF